MKEKNVLVTGASGFLGGWLTKKLIEDGSKVVALVREEKGVFPLVPSPLSLHVYKGLLEDTVLLERIIIEEEIEIIFHLGAQALVGHAIDMPSFTFSSNIQGTWNLLEACRKSKKIKAIVIASSDKAYGDQPTLPYTEEMTLKAVHPYDVSKVCAEYIARCYATTYSLPICITRCGNFFGGGDMHWSRIVPGTIRSIIFGRPIRLRSNGTLTRDYIYIEDVVDAYVCLARCLLTSEKFYGQAFNISTDTSYAVSDLVKTISCFMGVDSPQILYSTSSHEISHQHLCSDKMHAWTNWKARWGVEEGLKKSILWYRKFFSSKHSPLNSIGNSIEEVMSHS